MTDYRKISYNDQDGYSQYALEVYSDNRNNRILYTGGKAKEIYKIITEEDYLSQHDEKIKNDLIKKHKFLDLTFSENALDQTLEIKIDYNTVLMQFDNEDRLNIILDALKKALKIKGD